MTGPKRPTENRHFERIPFDAQATIRSGSAAWRSELLDISLKGALITRPSGWNGELGQTLELLIELSPEVGIDMQGSVAHIEPDHVGLRCDYIDAESISHLCRLIELNTGEPELVHRELNILMRLNESD